MEYSIGELTNLAGISTRTLRYYDQIGLLKPLYVNEAGYRCYGEQELLLLQQILFYRERGFDLKTIQQILYQKDFDIMYALQEHLAGLEAQRAHVDALIKTVRHTISSMKGEYIMTDKERFEIFKQKIVSENETMYGPEIRTKYGVSELEEYNQKLLAMSQEEWNDFENLEKEIKKCLNEAVLSHQQADSEYGKKITMLHKQWLCKTWKQYSAEAHKSLSSIYPADDRFRAYYDDEVPGCAEFLHQSVCCWAGRLPV